MVRKIKKHTCELDLGSDSMLPPKVTKCGRFLRQLRKLAQLSKHHPDTFDYFRSCSAVVAERQRQILEHGGRVIHPLSVFNMIWMSVMIVVNITHMCISSFRLFFVLQPIAKLQVHVSDLVLVALDVICFVDIVVKFNMGYINTKHNCIIMNRNSIFWHYFCRWFIPDLVSCLPIAVILLSHYARPRYILLAHSLSLVRTARIYTVVIDMKTIMQLFFESYIVHGLVRLAILFILSAHWCSCIMYVPTVVLYYWTAEMPTQYNFYMRVHNRLNLLGSTTQDRYNKAIIIALSAFSGTGFTMFRSTEPDEILFHSFIIVYAAMFMVFTLVLLIKTYLTIFGSSLRYQGLMNQVEEYMKYRQFPPSLKRRVYAFYQYWYQELYFKEEAFACLSEELRDEIKLHTCRILVHKVKLFEDVPPNIVGTILGCLHPEVYLSNDLVVRAGDIGDCMYFIASGTVAVYSLKGVEVCHLEDGEHFGEVALLMKDSKRVATVVAVEITQLYRLDAHDFNRFVLSHPTLHNRIEEMASRRMHATVLLDEAFRRDREIHGEKKQTNRPRKWVHLGM